MTQSPCILVCSIDLNSGYCYGCGRTRDEIASWMNLGEIEKQAVLDQLPARLETVERRPRRVTKRSRMRRNHTPQTF